MGTTKANLTTFRKITHNSSGTSSVSIPMEYIRVMRWHKGQRVKFIRRGRQLIIKPTR